MQIWKLQWAILINCAGSRISKSGPFEDCPLTSWGHFRVYCGSMLCRLRGELGPCRVSAGPGRSCSDRTRQINPGQQEDSSRIRAQIPNIHTTRQGFTNAGPHMHSGQVAMETTPPRELSSSHALPVVRCPSQTGTTAACSCVSTTITFHFSVTLKKVKPRGTSKVIIDLPFLSLKASCACACAILSCVFCVYQSDPQRNPNPGFGKTAT